MVEIREDSFRMPHDVALRGACAEVAADFARAFENDYIRGAAREMVPDLQLPTRIYLALEVVRRLA